MWQGVFILIKDIDVLTAFILYTCCSESHALQWA